MQRIRMLVLLCASVAIPLTTGLDFTYAAAAKVFRVYDGDTLSVTVQGERVSVRLYGIDAPESGQDGNVSATRFLKRLIWEHPLEIKVMETDRIGRAHAIVTRKGKQTSVNAAMVANGYSWVNPGRCRAEACASWKKLESHARKFKLGIWSGFDLVPPWEFNPQGGQ